MQQWGRARRNQWAWRWGAILVAALGLSVVACSDEGAGLADTCELPPSVVGLLTGLEVGEGVKTAPFEGASECRYDTGDGRYLLVRVNTSGSSFDTLGGRPISGVADGAKLLGNQLHVRSRGNTWTFEVEDPNYDADRLELVLVAVANEIL